MDSFHEILAGLINSWIREPGFKLPDWSVTDKTTQGSQRIFFSRFLVFVDNRDKSGIKPIFGMCCKMHCFDKTPGTVTPNLAPRARGILV